MTRSPGDSTSAGILVGLAGSLALTRALATLLYHVSPIDPVIFAATALVFIAVALLASYLPAFFAAGVLCILAALAMGLLRKPKGDAAPLPPYFCGQFGLQTSHNKT